MKKLMLAAMMMGMVAVTPVMAHASETEDTAVEAAMTEADENITQVLNWGENMEEEMAYKGYSGMFYTIDELNMRLMVPDGLEQRPRTEEEAASWMLFPERCGDDALHQHRTEVPDRP